VLAQFWYATQAELEDQLRRRLPPSAEAPVLEPAQDDDEMVDIGELDLSLEDLGRGGEENDEIEGAGPENEIMGDEANSDVTAELGTPDNDEAGRGIVGEGREQAPFTSNAAGDELSWPEEPHAGPDELFPEPEPVVSPYDDPFN
jgi:hypothetical protein